MYGLIGICLCPPSAFQISSQTAMAGNVPRTCEPARGFQGRLREHWQPVAWHEVARHGLRRPYDVLNEAWAEPEHGTLVLPPYAAWWLVDRA